MLKKSLKVFDAPVLGDRQIRCLISDATKDYAGDVIEPSGYECGYSDGTVPVLADHAPSITNTLGRAKVYSDSIGVYATVDFLPQGLSHIADLACAMYKNGFLTDVSIGFDPIEQSPLPGGAGVHYTKWRLLELSAVINGCNPAAKVIDKSVPLAKDEDWACGASRSLPIGPEGPWDGSAAAASIFEWAGGDSFDPDKARKGFLAYDRSNSDERGGYKLPFARVIDGRLTACPSGIRAAASRLPNTDIPQTVRDTAREVLNGYENRMGDKCGFARLRKSLDAAIGLLQVVGGLSEIEDWMEASEPSESDFSDKLSEILEILAQVVAGYTDEQLSRIILEEAEEGKKGIKTAFYSRLLSGGDKKADLSLGRERLACAKARLFSFDRPSAS